MFVPKKGSEFSITLSLYGSEVVEVTFSKPCTPGRELALSWRTQLDLPESAGEIHETIQRTP